MVSRRAQILDALLMLLLAACCFLYLFQKTAYTLEREALQKKEVVLNRLKEDNDAYEDSIEARMDIVAIKEKAFNEWGFRYPNEDQIKYYDVSNMSYVSQKMPLNTGEKSP